MPRRPPVVVLTTAPGSLAGLAESLRADGMTVREAPLLSFGPPADWGPVDRAIFRLPEFRAVAVSSPRAAQAFASRLALHQVSPPPGQEAWATGVATAEALRDLFEPVHTPSSLVTIDAGAGSMLATSMVAARVGSPIPYACGDTRRDEMPAVLRAAGVMVEEVICYRSVLAEPDEADRAVSGAGVVLIGSPKVMTLVARV